MAAYWLTQSWHLVDACWLPQSWLIVASYWLTQSQLLVAACWLTQSWLLVAACWLTQGWLLGAACWLTQSRLLVAACWLTQSSCNCRPVSIIMIAIWRKHFALHHLATVTYVAPSGERYVTPSCECYVTPSGEYFIELVVVQIASTHRRTRRASNRAVQRSTFHLNIGIELLEANRLISRALATEIPLECHRADYGNIQSTAKHSIHRRRALPV